MAHRGARRSLRDSLGRMACTAGVSTATLAFAVMTVAAQTPARPPPSSAESVTVVPGAIYRTGSLGRFFYGDHYRDLWTAPLTVPVLSLDQYAGGVARNLIKQTGVEDSTQIWKALKRAYLAGYADAQR